ncbi:flagellar basal-body rod protein FlgB [Nitrospira sp. KM1]|uniref:flagellar basal body rod protein FlgB n=1 Tax=Nitrospira sp. KM1 TaxID=1936990 RepID=UPI0013A73EB1|nr:flagellar basal body rod protein FlgB [Nitrospira sp. KM1]BCA54821.1 flagellar basal-body rod protein FlgB [Nitrospira sp. KM1]
MNIFDKTMGLVERTLDLRGARNRLIASNIANEETPGYRATDLHFQEALSSAAQGRPPVSLVSTHGRHFGLRGPGAGQVTGRVAEVPAGDLPLDANSVNIELELAKLSDNAMQYNSAAAIMGIRLRQLMSAIRDAR